MARRPVTCRNCGYTTTPVSGFCPRCIELLPVAPAFAAVPLLLGVLGAFVLGVGLIAALSRAAPEVVSVQGSATATPPSATAQSTPVRSPGQPIPSASSVVSPAAGASPPPTAVLGAESLPSTATDGEVMH